MNQPFCSVLLAGRIRSSSLQQALDVHVLCLPIGRRGSLLDAWVRTLSAIEGMVDVQAVVNTGQDVESIRATTIAHALTDDGMTSVRIVAEPAPWRGAGGIVRDVTRDLPDNAIVIACEAKRLPPGSLRVLVEPFETDHEAIGGVVGICSDGEPAGVYAFRRRALELIPDIGYYDMKEQFLPALAVNGINVVTARLPDDACRLNDLENYLIAVRKSLANGERGGTFIRASDQASISGSAVLEGACIVEAGAVIEDGAVVHDSVVLWGATVGGGAVLSQSVAGPLAQIEPRSRVIREVVARPAAALHQKGAAQIRRVLGKEPVW